MTGSGRPPPEERVRRIRGCAVPARIDPAGLSGPTKGEAYGPGWRRTGHGYFLPASVDDTRVERRIVEAAAVLPPDGAVTGWAALRWSGAMWFDGLAGDGVTRRPVPVLTGCGAIRPQHGIAVSSELRRPGEIVEVDGLAVTIPVRSALFEVRYAESITSAVVAADMTMEADLATPQELTAYAATLGTWTGIPQAREALPLARENSWSPQEPRLRVLWKLLAGFPEPLCNRPVFDLSGRHIGTPDLLDPVSGVVGEYEGVVHLKRRQRGIDVRREQALRDAGLECFSVVAADWADETVIAARIRSAYARAASRPVSERAWTIEQPAWWVPTHTVALRRALSARERQVWLSNRAG